jgi:hypothetical protein
MAIGKTRKIIAAATLAIAGFGAGAAATVLGPASADSNVVSTTAAGTGDSTADGVDNVDPTKSMRSDEHLLTGTTKAKVTAVVKAKYPDATIQRVETDSDGVYEAHIVTAGNQEVIVQVGKDFTITGTQTGHGPRGRHDSPETAPAA